jgi:DNA-binding NarL/FixJ family response regulator
MDVGGCVTAGDDAPPEPGALGPGRPQVGLLDLTPVVERGLRTALEDAGFDVRGADQVHGWTRQEGVRMVVTSDDEAALATVERLQRRLPEVRSVALLRSVDTRGYARALARCTAAVPMEAELDELVATVWAASLGRTLLPALVARELAARAETSEAVPDLSEQQLRWLRALAASATVTSLAKSAGYSEREMYRLLSALYSRLGVTTRTEALLRADRWGLLQEERVAGAGTTLDLTAHDSAAGGRRSR